MTLSPDSSLERALELAVKAHRGQRDKAGMPYILHPLTLMQQFEILEEKVVALLHDSVEDSDLTLDDLVEEGFSKTVVSAVDALTHRPDEGYTAYLHRVRRDDVARRVKLADLAHNMDLRRIETVQTKDLERLKKYHTACKFLNTPEH